MVQSTFKLFFLQMYKKRWTTQTYLLQSDAFLCTDLVAIALVGNLLRIPRGRDLRPQLLAAECDWAMANYK